MNPIGVFGGTFDPIHYGHLRTAFELLKSLQLSEVRFIPCGIPPHREKPVANARTRLAMVAAAIDGQTGFNVDDREIRRDGPSYSVDTLLSLRSEYPHRSLCLIIGMDAFLGLPRWHHWREILQLAHVVVAHRPGWRTPDSGALAELLVDSGTGSRQDLHEYRAGRIYIHAVTQLEISSTDLRAIVRDGGDPRFLMPERVRELIVESCCYGREKPTEIEGQEPSLQGEPITR